jgi:hypothetical protein
VSAIDRRAWLKEALETPANSAGSLGYVRNAGNTNSEFCHSLKAGKEEYGGNLIGLVCSGMDSPDPNAWAQDFERWAISECVYRPRGFQSTSSLHINFCDWTIRHNSVPCRRMEFDALLSMQGFFEADGLVHGLMLGSDLKVLTMGAQR